MTATPERGWDGGRTPGSDVMPRKRLPLLLRWAMLR